MRWSPPEQNASGPSPVSRTTPVDGSSRTSAKASWSSKIVSGRNALRTSGRLMVILAIPSNRSYLMSVKSRTFCQATATPTTLMTFSRLPPTHDHGRGVIRAASVHRFEHQALGGGLGAVGLSHHDGEVAFVQIAGDAVGHQDHRVTRLKLETRKDI